MFFLVPGRLFVAGRFDEIFVCAAELALGLQHRKRCCNTALSFARFYIKIQILAVPGKIDGGRVTVIVLINSEVGNLIG